MAKTSYDDIWTCFLENCQVNPSDIPQAEETIYSCIENAVRLYNQKAKKYEGRMKLVKCNEIMEELSDELNNDELLILSNIIATVVCRNALLHFSTLYGTFTKEMGLKNVKGQTDGLRQNLSYFESMVQSLIEDLVNTFDI